jgi:hypothetical protein
MQATWSVTSLPSSGAVPDGARVVGVPLTLAHSAVPGDLDLSWGASCAVTDDDYAVYEGVLGDFTSHIPVTASSCTTIGATTTTITPGGGDRYYLVVPTGASGLCEGSYGFASDGTPRPQSLSACAAQSVNECAQRKTVFVTSVTYDGNLGGLAGADANCQALADAAGLGGTYKAWLSDSSTDARDRLTHATVPYVRTDGASIADDWADLVDNPAGDPLLNPIDRDENGNAVGNVRVWTGTTFAGQMLPGDTICSDWLDGTASFNGRTGRTNRVDLGWTSVLTLGCNTLRALYCFEQ